MQEVAPLRFEPHPVVITITFETIEIGPYPSVVRRIWGRGAWPHHNFIFPLADVWYISKQQIESAYHTIGAELAISHYLQDNDV